MEKILEQKLELIKNDLKDKTLEELLLINDNIENYVSNYVKQEENEVENLKNEINQQVNITELKYTIEQKQKEIQNLLEEKKKLESEYSKDKIINQLNQEIEEKYNRPKHQLINDLANKKINFAQYIEQFKLYGMKYNYYKLLLEELKKKF